MVAEMVLIILQKIVHICCFLSDIFFSECSLYKGLNVVIRLAVSLIGHKKSPRTSDKVNYRRLLNGVLNGL